MAFKPNHSVYVMKRSDGTPIYIGCTSSFLSRVCQHSAKAWWPNVRTIEITHVAGKDAAFQLEAALIDQYCPEFNSTHAAKRPPEPIVDEARFRALLGTVGDCLPTEHLYAYASQAVELFRHQQGISRVWLHSAVPIPDPRVRRVLFGWARPTPVNDFLAVLKALERTPSDVADQILKDHPEVLLSLTAEPSD